jgi:hypothetical protein
LRVSKVDFGMTGEEVRADALGAGSFVIGSGGFELYKVR